jgi:hypothetical protein
MLPLKSELAKEAFDKFEFLKKVSRTVEFKKRKFFKSKSEKLAVSIRQDKNFKLKNMGSHLPKFTPTILQFSKLASCNLALRN